MCLCYNAIYVCMSVSVYLYLCLYVYVSVYICVVYICQCARLCVSVS